MSAAGSYAPSNVSDRRTTPPAARPPRSSTAREADPKSPEDPEAAGPQGEAAPPRERIDLSTLSIAGISRRHVAWIAAGLVSAWIVVIFARQAADAADAAKRANQVATDNTALALEVQRLESELALVVRPEYVAQEARAHQLGGAHEIPFTLDSKVPAPVDGAPGSASARLGAQVDRKSPLESWLSLLFGPGD